MTTNRNEKRRRNAAASPVPDIGNDAATPQPSGLGLNYATPTEIVDLPSQGLFYPKNSPMYGKKTIEIRYMTAKDEDILTSPTLLRKGLAIERMLQNIIIDNDVNTTDMLIGDKNALLFAARVTGYGRSYEAEVTCANCGHEHDHYFDLAEYVDNYKFTDPSESKFELTDNGTMMVQLPTTKVMIEMRFMTGQDEDFLQKSANKQSKLNLGDSVLTNMFKRLVISANGVQNPTEIGQFIDNMPAIDARYLRAAYSNVAPNVQFVSAVECPQCGEHTETEVPITAGFFWPQ